jgi:hypothetical protein
MQAFDSKNSGRTWRDPPGQGWREIVDPALSHFILLDIVLDKS